MSLDLNFLGTFFLPRNIFQFFGFFIYYDAQIMMPKRQWYNSIWKVKPFMIKLWEFSFYGDFFTISPLLVVSLDSFLVSAGGFSKVLKFTSDLILCAKFSYSSRGDPFLIPLCFLFKFLSLNNSSYSFGFTASVTRQGLSILSISS